jgi:hypothetical protein
MGFPEVEQFAASVRTYCANIEAAHTLPLAERLKTFAYLLAELYAGAWRLPMTDAPIIVPPDPPAPNWVGFDDLTLYWEVADPHEWQSPTTASLTDDLLGIYKALSVGLTLYDDNIPDAIGQWRSSFDTDWGNRVANALRALHCAIKRLEHEQ